MAPSSSSHRIKVSESPDILIWFGHYLHSLFKRPSCKTLVLFKGSKSQFSQLDCFYKWWGFCMMNTRLSALFSLVLVNGYYWRYLYLRSDCAPLTYRMWVRLCREKVMSWFTMDQSECNIIRIWNSCLIVCKCCQGDTTVKWMWMHHTHTVLTEVSFWVLNL